MIVLGLFKLSIILLMIWIMRSFVIVSQVIWLYSAFLRLFYLCSSVWAFFMPHMCLHNMLVLSSPFLIVCNTVISVVFRAVSSVSFLCFCCLIFLLIRFIFQLLCMPGNYLSDARHHKFDFARCWVFLYFFKYFWELFSDAVRLLVSSLVLLRLTFKLC